MANGYDDPRSTVLCDADKDCWLYDRFNNDKDDDELQDDGNDSDVTVRATALIQGDLGLRRQGVLWLRRHLQ